MSRVVKILLMIALSVPQHGCRRPVPYRGPQIEKPSVQAYATHPAWSSLQALIDDFKLDRAEVRYRQGLPETRKSAVYFMEEGNLHVEAVQVENGDWLLMSAPYLEPLELPVTDRISKWDAAVEPENSPEPTRK